jgi:ubiquinone/menaquinone biosynthesis C-methylase UbiE
MGPNGVLDRKYSEERSFKSELKFRLKTRAQVVVDIISKYFKTIEGLEILDFGAAEGKTLIEIKKSLDTCKFTGVESSGSLLSSVRNLPSQVRLIKGDVCRLPDEIPRRKFDAVIALACLEHLEEPLTAIEEAVRVLKPNGLFIATCPVPFWDYIACKLKLTQMDQHESSLDKQELISLIDKADMDFIEFKQFMWAPISFLPYLNIQIPIKSALRIDCLLEKIKILNWLFVNQCIIAVKK